MTSVSTPANRQRARTLPRAHVPRTYAAGFLAAIVIAIFIAVFLQSPHQAAEAQTSTVLVKNTGQTTGSGNYKLTSTNHSRAQQFTTGDNTSGYTLDSIGILFHAISNIATAGAHLTVTLNEVSNGNPASSVLCTLTDPNAFTASGVQTFAAPATDPCPTLTPNTPYFFVIKRVQHVTTDVISLKATSATAEDHNAAMGWLIGNDRHLIGTSNTWSSIPSQPYLIEVTGTTLASYTVPLNWPLKPHGLVGGDQFRLLFVTSTTSDATSENIATYNTFVRTVAESGHDAIHAYSPGFTAIASTAATDARDNTGTTYTNDDKGVPIYWVGGANLAADYADFYDGSWNNEDKAKDESGSVRSTTDVSDYPFTGSDHDGTERFAALVSEAMGSSNTNVAIGRPNSSTTSGDGPLSGAMQTTAKTNSRPLYALSQVFTIDNAETTILETTITVESFGNVSGYSILYLLGDIQDPSFSYKGRTGTIREVTTSALEGETEFLLGIPGFFTDVDRDTAILTNWSLHVGDTAFADDAGNDHFDGEIYGWTQLPSTWNDNDVITIRLLTTEPSAPTSLTAVDNDPNGTTVTLTWTAPTTGGSAITKYQYRHSGIEPDTHSEWTDIPGGGTITTADVTFPVGWPDGPYQFNVRAFNDDGDGLWSEPAYATVFDERGLTVSNTSQTVNSQVYTLTDSSDLPSRAQQFTTGKNPAGYTLESASAKFNSITNTGTVGAQLAVTLNATASGAPSSTALCTLTDPGTFATSGVHTFTAPTTDLCPALTPSTEYFIVVTRVEHVAADVIALDATASTDQDEASAANWTIGNSRHFYGSSNTWSSTASEPHLIAVTAKSLPNAPNAPDAPSVQATPGTTNSLNVSWPAPANIGNPVITDFDLQYQQVGTTTWTEWPHVGTALSTNITPLNPGTSYRVQLRATNAAGTSPWSRPRQAPTDAPPAKVPSNWPLIPTGLSPGSKFRLIFATSTTRDATSTDINDYNTFAQTAAAAGHTDIRKYSSSFAVVGSTSSIHARDNTVTAFTATNKGVPIYWLAGAKAADNYQDFYDGSWDDESNTKDESGNTRSLALLANRPFTGTEHNGTEAFTYDGHSTALGAATVQLGTPNRDNSFQGPLSGSHIDQGSDSRPFYALSQVFEVAPNNFPTGAPTVTGTPRVGEILTADTSGIQDLDGLTTPDWTYQWVRVDGDSTTNVGTDSSTYTLVEADAEKQIRVDVTFTDDVSNPEGPLSSALTDTIAPSDLLVRNTGQTAQSPTFQLSTVATKRAQAFTTGSHSAGYTLNSIGLSFGDIAEITTAGAHLTVTLSEVSSGDPGSALCTLTDPATFTGAGVQTFDAPAADPCPTLTASTTYFAVIERVVFPTPDTSISLTVTTSGDEDSGGAMGWTISDARQYFGSVSWTSTASQSHLIEVKGVEVNNLATGAPTITGTPRVGEVLTADTSAIMDADGLTAPNYSYQWVRVDGGSTTNVGTDSSTYTLVDADAEKRIRVDVTFTDDGSTTEGPLSSALTDTIVPANVLVSNTGQTMSGSQSVGDNQPFAQSFETGTHPHDYDLDSIVLRITAAATVAGTLTVTVRADNSGDPSSTVLYTLTGPGTIAAGLNEFTAPSGARLQPNTTYHVVAQYSSSSANGPSWARANIADGLDSGGATGWNINKAYRFSSDSGATWSEQSSTRTMQMQVRGAEAGEPPNRVTGFALDSNNSDPTGIWGNDDTFWVANDGTGATDKLYAYNRSDGTRDSSSDFDNLNGAGNNDPEGICSDGTTMFVADSDDNMLYAYNMSDTTRDLTKEITLHSANGEARGVWCDGTTVYVANDGSSSAANKVFAYTISNGNRDSSKDFEELYVSTQTAAENAETPWGIWSNGTTMFVVDSDDDNVFAYKHSDESQDSDKNVALDSANADPNGMWFDGRVLWVVDDTDDRLYPYDLPGANPGNTPAEGQPLVRSTLTRDVYTATVTAAVSPPPPPGQSGYAVAGIFAITFGSISESTFTVDGVEYTVRAVLDGNQTANTGDLILELDKALPRGFTFTADGVTYASDDATESEPGTGRYRYQWSANLSWTLGSVIPVVLSVETPKDGLDVTADPSGITDSTDELENASFHYQWVRVDGTDETEIEIGAVGATYTPTADDVGDYLKVRAIFNDDAGNQEYPITSPRFGPVVDAVAPTFVSAVANTASTIVLTFDEPLDPDSIPAGTAFTVQVGDNINNVDTVEVNPDDDAQIVLTVGAPMLSRETISVTYSKPASNPLQDPHQNEVESSPRVSVTNEFLDTFVSNLGQTAATTVADLTMADYAQRIDAGTTASFDFEEIEVVFATVPSNTATVSAVIADGVGTGSNIVATLTNPSTWSTNAVFGIPDGTELVKGTNYYIIFEGDEGALQTTTSDNEDSGTAADWDIENAAVTRADQTQSGFGGTWAHDASGASLQIAIRGLHHGRPGTPALEVTGKDQGLVLEVTVPDHGSSDLTAIEYSYKETTGGTYTSFAPVTVQPGTNLNSGGTFEITGLDNGTDYTVQVQTVNNIGTSDASNEDSGTPEAPPAITSVAITSDPGADKTYDIGDEIVVTVTFDKNITIMGTGENPLISINVGTGLRQPNCSVGTPPTMAMTCTFTVRESNEDTDGISFGSNVIEEETGTHIVGPLGQRANLAHNALDDDANHKVDGIRPTLTGARASDDLAKITLTFSEAIGSVDRTKITFMSGTTAVTTTADSISGSEVEITLTTALTDMDTNVTVALAADAVTDAVGNGNAELLSSPVKLVDEIWSATLTVKDLGSSFLGCDTSETSKGCEPSELLTDNDFSYDSVDYQIDVIDLKGGTLRLEANIAFTAASLADLTLNVGSDSFPFEDATHASGLLTWSTTGLTWSEDDMIVLSIDADPPPMVVTAIATTPTTIVLTFDEPLDAASIPAASAFTVQAGGAANTVDSVAADADDATQLALTVSDTMLSRDTITVSYTEPDSNPLRDAEQNEVVSFDSQAVGNDIRETFVSNLGQNPAGVVGDLSTEDHAQLFDTGTTASFDFTEVEVLFKTPPSTTATVTAIITDGLGSTDNTVATLTNPTDWSANSKFGIPDGTTLSPDTTYWLIIEGTDGQLQVTTSDDEDSAAAGWNIHDDSSSRADETLTGVGGTWSDAGNASLQIAVRGKEHGRPGTPELAVTAKDQTLVLDVTVPDHGSSPLTGIEYRYKETTGGTYSGWTPVTETFTNMGGTFEIGGLDNGTEYTAQVQTVNDIGTSDLSEEGSATPDVPPELTSIAITSNAGADETYAIGEVIEFTVTFDKDLTVAGSDTSKTPATFGWLLDYAADTPGVDNPEANCAIGTNTMTLVCPDTIAEGWYDTDGIAIAANPLSMFYPVTFIAGPLGQRPTDLTYSAVAVDSDHKVDGIRPTLTGARASADKTKIILTFSEAIGSVDRTKITVKSGTTTLTTTADSISGSVVEITLTTALTASDTMVTVALAADAVTDVPGNGIAEVPAKSFTTATVTISGKPRVDETLTVAVTDISDAEGVTNIDLQYQWTRDDGTDISGASSATYTLTDADAEHEINVNVTFSDDEGNPEGPFTATSTEAVVPTEVLVRNIGQSPESAGEDFDNISPTQIAQAFTTGANSDGYALTSIGVHFHTIANTNTAASRITATLNVDSSGLPGAALCTLTDPPSFSASGLHTFTAPATDRCTVLEANTTYWVALVNDASHQTRLTVTTSSNEDSGGLGDWLIADSHHQFTGSNQWINYLDAILIEFRGENAVPNVSATGVPTISGTPQEGSTLTAGTSGIADGNGLGTLKYQWVRVTGTVQTDIDGATSSTHALTDKDLDQTIIVRVSFIDQDGHAEGPLASAATAVVTAPNLLVKNTLASDDSIPTQASDPRIAQAFTTGSSLGGYQLASVGFRLHAVADPASAGNDLEVTLNEVASSGEPGAALCTLEDPGTFVANSINRFTAPSGDDCPILSRNTTYFAVLHRVAFTGSNTIAVGVASSPAEDEGSATNWSIANTGYFGAGTTWSTAIVNYRIEVTGEEGIEVEVPPGWSLTPSGLVGGQKFRLLFITLTGHSSANTDIESYNTYVQSQANAANAHTDIKAYHSHFRVLGSTAAVDARDNTRTNPSDYASVPIYWMGGDKVADNYGDFYDGSWDSEEWTGPTGTSPSSTQVLMGTGSENNGTEAVQQGVSRAMGSTTAVRIGTVNGTGDPLSAISQTAGTNHRYYALSNIFVVPNTEATGQPAITGTPRVNETLTADTSDITDPEGTGNANFTYQWIRVDDADSETDIEGATRSTYRPKDEDADKKLKVRVSFTDDQGFEEGPFISEPTARILDRDVLVSNLNQSDNRDFAFAVAAPISAQGFTTGAETDGYTLDSVVVPLLSSADLSTIGPQITATIRNNANGLPGTTLCTLVDPPSFDSGRNTFTAPTTGTTCPILSANTTYFIAVEHSAPATTTVHIGGTTSSSEDPGSRTNWSILNINHYYGTSWNTDPDSIRIQIKGRSSAQEIESDHTTWVDNRQGDADTDYENLGSYSIAQGFRTGDTAGIFDVNEIHIDFDSGQTEYQKIELLITESTTPDAEVNTGRPSGFRKGGSFYSQEVDSDGTVTFPRHSGYKWLEANTNYFLIISSTSDDPNAAPTLRMTEHEGQDSSDGWSIDDQSYSKAKTGGARWTRQDHQVRFRISGEYHQGLSLYLEPTKYESCPNKPCVVAVLQTNDNMGMEGRRFPGSLDSATTWISTQENMEFKAALWPIPTVGQWVEFDYDTSGWTATAGEDFHNTHGTVRFSAGDKLKTIKVELIDDSIEDSGEQLRMRIGVYLTTTSDAGRTYQPGDLKVRTGGGYPFPEVTKYSAFGTILNSEEETETRWLKVSGATITEGVETAAEFTVSLTGTLTAPVWFNYATVDGSAVAGTHYTATSGETHIPHGATSVTVSVPILDFDDDVYTGNRQFTLQLSNITVAAVGTDSATATIKDDDPQPLTASFTNLPPGHDGENAFKFDISFNQDVATQRLVMQEDVMTVTNGAITGAGRVDGAKSRWRITVEPVDGRDVTVELPATTDCSATGAVCTGGDNPQPLSNGITHTFPGTKLNAEFEGFDFYHDGSTPMQFRLVFSKEVDTTPAEIKDHALTVTGATINTVVQKDEGSTRRWNVTVTPAGTGPFDVILAAATDCALDGHICTADGELLAQGDWKRSSGPPVISVADAAVTEGDGAQLAFAVTLDRNWSGPIPTVSYATSDGTASAGSDYTAGSGSLTLGWTHTGSLIRPWTLAGAITVPVTNDTVVEETETLTLTLSSPIWATLGDATATGTIEEDDVAVVREPDSAPTGLPVITGTPEADSVLTADTSAIDDANGLTEVSYSYQWIVTTDGADADIEGATTSTYTPRAAHVGKTFKVSVSFTDDDDYQHTLTSGPTTPITRNTDAIVWSADMLVVEYTAVSIGAASADLFSNIGGTGSLQIKSLWSYVPDSDLRLAFTDTFDDAEDHTLIVGDLTLEFPAGSSGEQSFKWTNAGVDWTDGETIAVSIVPTTPAEPTPNTTATGEPTISGTPQVGERLTAGTADIGDADGLENVSYNYQWIAGDADIQHATGSAHTLTDDDEGKAIKVKVSFTDDRGNAESLTSQATTAVAARPNRPASGAPSIQGVLQDQQVLTADSVGIADADGLENATISYQWMRVADGDAVDITGATSSTYTLTSTDVGDSIQLQAAFTDDRESAESVTSAVTDAVVASGATRELLWLSTMTPEDPDGLDTDFNFDSVANQGSLSPAAFTDGADTRAITFLGASFGSNTTLALELGSEPSTAQTATWRLQLHDTELAFADATMTQTGASPPAYRFQWDATALAVDDTDLWDDGDAFTVSLLKAVNLSATGVPTIDGTPQVGETLTAAITGITDGNGLDGVSYAYQWTAGGSNIDGATGSSLTLTSSQEGQTVQVQVSFNDDDGFSETATSVATDAVAAAEQANNPATGLPSISGTPQVEQTLTADTSNIDDEDGLDDVAYSYQWLSAGTAISGATGSTYTLTANEQGDTIQVRVDFEDDAANSETLTSVATDPVAAAKQANTAPTGLPTISGTPQVGQTLTADTSTINDGNGLTNVSYRYQWVRNDGNDDADIAGGTSSTYTLVDADEGRTIRVKVSFTDDANNDESLTSTATETVLARANTPAAGAPTISGTPQVEQTLTADTSGISDEDGLTNVSYAYQWLAAGTAISGATGSTYQLTSTEQGKTIQVRVDFTDDAGNSESLTSVATDAVAAKPVPLTATFSNVPDSHSGSGEFTFDLSFSENFPLSYRTLRDHAFTEDDHGPVTKAQRKVQGSNQTWTITVEPDGNGAITITLPATTDCNATGAICTDDGRKLSNSTTIVVPGPQ